jgi:hypothetical protein
LGFGLQVGFENRQARLRAIETLELRAKQFRSREGIWPFRVPHEPLDLEDVAGDGLSKSDGRMVLRMEWPDHAWDLWAIALPSGILLYCDSDGSETRVLASARRGNPGDADGFFLERLAESRGHHFGIEMAGPAPDRVRSSIGDRDFLADLFVELFEETEAEGDIRLTASAKASAVEKQDATRADERDFRADVVRWLGDVLTAPPAVRRQPRVAAEEP